MEVWFSNSHEFFSTFETSFLASKYREACCNVKKSLLRIFLWLMQDDAEVTIFIASVCCTKKWEWELVEPIQVTVLNFAEHKLAYYWCLRSWLREASLPTDTAVSTCGRCAGSRGLTGSILRAIKRHGEETGCFRNQTFPFTFWSTQRFQSSQGEARKKKELYHTPFKIFNSFRVLSK